MLLTPEKMKGGGLLERASLAQNLRHLIFTHLHGELERRLSGLRRRGGGQRPSILRPQSADPKCIHPQPFIIAPAITSP